MSQSLEQDQRAERRAHPPGKRPLGKPETLLKAIVVFNLFDALLSLAWISAGRATEANPLMKGLAESRPVLFVGVKLALVSLGGVVLWRHQKRPSALAGTLVLFFVFYGSSCTPISSASSSASRADEEWRRRSEVPDEIVHAAPGVAPTADSSAYPRASRSTGRIPAGAPIAFATSPSSEAPARKAPAPDRGHRG